MAEERGAVRAAAGVAAGVAGPAEELDSLTRGATNPRLNACGHRAYGRAEGVCAGCDFDWDACETKQTQYARHFDFGKSASASRAEILAAVDAAEESLVAGKGRVVTDHSMRTLAAEVKERGRARLEAKQNEAA